MQINRPTVLDMTPPKKSLLPTWRVVTRRGPVYASVETNSESSALEMSEFSNSVSMPCQTSSSLPCLDHSNQDLNKALPPPPSRIHSARHSFFSLYYHRLRKLEGYHFGVLWCAGVAAIVLVINLILTIWAVAKSGVQDGLGTLQGGSCKRTMSLTNWIHIVINVLSTLLLGASNYSMQCLSAPTRSEVDKAHRQGIWLDIGVPSVRNLRRLSTPRIVLWWLLAISSIPLHLLYNSAVFSTLSTQQFNAYLVTAKFLDGQPFNVEAPIWGYTNASRGSFDDVHDALQDIKANQSYVKLQNEECVDTYSASIIPTNSNLFLVSDYQDANNSLIWSDIEIPPRLISGDDGVFCSLLLCDGTGAITNPRNLSFNTSVMSQQYFTAFDYQATSVLSSINYCFSKRAKENCKLQFSLTIMIMVIICNMIKTVCMAIISWKQDPEPLVTLGDAIASFLDRPDVITDRHCIAGRTWFEDSRYWARFHLSRWDPKHLRWFRAASRRRWIVCNVLYTSTLVATGALLIIGLRNHSLTSRSLSHLWSLGLGNVNAESLVAINSKNDLSGPAGVIATVLIANSPQILLSFLYFSYNGVFTCMLLAEEWSAYGTKKRFLRVTSPTGGQRSTYYLQLPYRYSIPLLIGSSVLHWLVSQSIFLARVNTIDSAGVEIPGADVSTCGYSPMAMIFVIILGSIVVLLGICFGLRKARGGMPLAGSCSAAISAACHPPEADVDASMKRIMWGVVAEDCFQYGGEGVGHCSFTSSTVEAPVVGKWYAGVQ